jgi:hypothetical protein
MNFFRFHKKRDWFNLPTGQFKLGRVNHRPGVNKLPFLVIAIGIFVLSQNVWCDTVLPPCTYQRFSEDKKLVFVMLAPNDKRGVECLGRKEAERKEAQEIENNFKDSGLYSVDDTSTPRWKIDWYSNEVFVSDDGQHVIRTGPLPTSPTEEAFSLVENGEIKKTYTITDVISWPRFLPHSASHFEWKKEIMVDNMGGTFTVTTLEGKSFVFNLKTGQLVSKIDHAPFCGGLALLIGLVVIRLLA